MIKNKLWPLNLQTADSSNLSNDTLSGVGFRTQITGSYLPTGTEMDWSLTVLCETDRPELGWLDLILFYSKFNRSGAETSREKSSFKNDSVSKSTAYQ